jgi:hypothetical protein
MANILNISFVAKFRHDMVNRYGISVSQMTTDMFRLSESKSSLFSFITGFITQGTGRIPLVEQEILIHRCGLNVWRFQVGNHKPYIEEEQTIQKTTKERTKSVKRQTMIYKTLLRKQKSNTNPTKTEMNS